MSSGVNLPTHTIRQLVPTRTRGSLEWVNIGRQSEDVLELRPTKFLADYDSVAVVGHARIFAKPTSEIYETDFVHLITVREGKVVKFQEFFDTFAAGEAFRAS